MIPKALADKFLLAIDDYSKKLCEINDSIVEPDFKVASSIDICDHDWIYIGTVDKDGYNIPDYPLNEIKIFDVYRCRLCGEYDERTANIGKKRVVK